MRGSTAYERTTKMICSSHIGQFFTAAAGACKECGETTNSCFALCESCSAGLGECEYCRQPVKSPWGKRAIAAFKSPRAAQARRSCVEARLRLNEAYEAAHAVYAEQIAPLEVQLRADMKPFEEKEQAATLAFREAYAAACEADRIIQDNPAATAGEKLDSRNRWSEAGRLLGQRCKPHADEFQQEVASLREQFKEQAAPFAAIRDAACINAELECAAVLNDANRRMQKILARARFWDGLFSLIGA